MAISDWPLADRPREKLLQRGAAYLSDAELLAIFLRVGVAGKSAVDLARDLLEHFGSLQQLFAASQEQLSAVKGMGEAKYVQLQAVLEMARRTLEEELKCSDVLQSPQAVRRFLLSWLRPREYEVFVALFLDGQNQVLLAEELFRGTINQTQVFPREVARRALLLNASAVIVAHNHPSGSATVSASDEAVTRTLKEALALLDIRLLDHFIVAGAVTVSLAEQGLL